MPTGLRSRRTFSWSSSWTLRTWSLPAVESDDLDPVSASVIQHSDRRAGHLGRGHNEVSAQRFHAIVLLLNIVHIEHGSRLFLLELCLLKGSSCRVVVERELQLRAVRL